MSINLYDYKRFVVERTAPQQQWTENEYHLNHACVGLATEYLELLRLDQEHPDDDSTPLEELGDLLFYVVLAGYALGIDLEALHLQAVKQDHKVQTNWQGNLIAALEIFISICKKVLIYGNPQHDMLYNEYHLNIAYGQLWNSLILCEFTSRNVTLEKVLLTNQDKLSKRYKTSFTKKEAAERKDKQ